MSFIPPHCFILIRGLSEQGRKEAMSLQSSRKSLKWVAIKIDDDLRTMGEMVGCGGKGLGPGAGRLGFQPWFHSSLLAGLQQLFLLPAPEATFPGASWDSPSVHALSDFRASAQSIYILPAWNVLHTPPYLAISHRILRLSLGRS